MGDPRPLTWAHRQREWMDRTDEDAIKNRRQAPYILVLVKRLPSWFAGGAQGALTAGEKKEKYAAVAVQLDTVHGHGGWMRSVSRHWAPSAETNHLVIWTPAGTGN